MFADMDRTLREIGVGDMTIARNVKAMWEALHGRSSAYVAALGDATALAAALGRNVWRGHGTEENARRLATYAQRATAALDEQDLPALQAGRVSFPAPDRALAA